MRARPRDWVPLSVRYGVDALEADPRRVQSLPSWARPSVYRWVSSQVHHRGHMYARFATDLVLEFERRTRRALTDVHAASHASDKRDRLVAAAAADDRLLLDLLDFLVAVCPRADSRTLDRYLREAGSVWRVTVGVRVPALVRVIDLTDRVTAPSSPMRDHAVDPIVRSLASLTAGQVGSTLDAVLDRTRRVRSFAGSHPRYL